MSDSQPPCFLCLCLTPLSCSSESVSSWSFHSCPYQPLHFHHSHLTCLTSHHPVPFPSTASPFPLLTSLSSCPSQPISYDVFKLFMRAYLEVDLPQPLSTHLFLAFSQKPRQETPDHPKEGASSSEPNVSGTRSSFPQDGRMLNSYSHWQQA